MFERKLAVTATGVLMENTCKIGDSYICYNAELIEHKENVCDYNVGV